jgi:coenzyme F420 hydrogenase subunit beta
MCIDHSGEWSDISVGDPWYRARAQETLGRSLIVARTERGRRVIRRAVESGYLVVTEAPANALALSQPSFLEMRGKVWARIATSRIMREPAPEYRHMAMGRFWLRVLTPSQKARAFIGTAWKILKRRAREKPDRARLEPRRAKGASAPAGRHDSERGVASEKNA